MELRTLSQKRGIYSIYNGSKYIIYSEFYGVVAETTEILREDNNVILNFDICQWYGYWALKPIISRGIKKLENRYVEKNVIINYNTIKDTDNSLNKYLTFDIIDR